MVFAIVVASIPILVDFPTAFIIWSHPQTTVWLIRISLSFAVLCFILRVVGLVDLHPPETMRRSRHRIDIPPPVNKSVSDRNNEANSRFVSQWSWVGPRYRIWFAFRILVDICVVRWSREYSEGCQASLVFRELVGCNTWTTQHIHQNRLRAQENLSAGLSGRGRPVMLRVILRSDAILVEGLFVTLHSVISLYATRKVSSSVACEDSRFDWTSWWPLRWPLMQDNVIGLDSHDPSSLASRQDNLSASLSASRRRVNRTSVILARVTVDVLGWPEATKLQRYEVTCDE